MNKIYLLLLVSWVAVSEAKVQVLAREPYVGAIVVDADSGQVLFSDNADARAYPASVLKLMDLLIILEKIEQGALHYSDVVHVTAEASKTGGSQVYLKEHEEFTIEELLYALMIQSGNDAAVALAIHVAGSKDGFVSLMNERAKELGLADTRFHSVHGLPPSTGQEPDVMSARDLATLCLELAKHPDAFKFTATRERAFRPEAKEPFIMRTHNHLLGSFKGCDGFKTGYFTAAGFSIAATAKRGDARVICVVLGCPMREKRDAKTAELLAKGFLILPEKMKKLEPLPVPAGGLPPPAPMPVEEEIARPSGGVLVPLTGGIFIGLGVAGMVWGVKRWRARAQGDFVRRS